MPLRLLAIDTSTEACSAALAIGREIVSRFELAPKRHTELILSMVDQLLATAGVSVRMLDGLAFGRGPGSFTGVRIAAGVIQGIALGARLPVAPISSLAALAHEAYLRTGQRRVLPAIDARMGEIYLGTYQIDTDGIARATQPECVGAPETAPLPATETWLGVGTGWHAYGAILARRLGTRLAGMDPKRYPHAHAIAILGIDAFERHATVSAEEALPVYLRDKVADDKAMRK